MNTPNNYPGGAHEALRDDLKAYVDGELPLLRRAAVHRHLARCEACRTEMKDMENITHQLRENNAVETPLDAGLRAKILGGTPAPDRTFETVEIAPRRRRRFGQIWEYGLLGALSCLIIFATMTTLGKKVQTVFNVANNALTDGGSGEYYAQAPAAAPEAENESSAQSNVKPLTGNWRKDMPGSAGASAGAVSSPDISRRVHKEASIGVAVKSAESASDSVVALVQGAGGFIAGNSLTTGADNSKNAAIEVRVPVARFESVLREIGKLGEVKSKNISGQDLTERFSDADEARRIMINDLSIKEAQLRAAKERAEAKKRTYVPDWQQRAELRDLRIRAAQARARLELLRKTTDLANISVQLQESAVPPGQAGFWQSLNTTKGEAAQSFTAVARIPIACVIWILAYSPLWLPLLFAWWYFNRAPKSTV